MLRVHLQAALQVNETWRTFGDDALHAHHGAQQAGREGTRRDVFAPEAALQSDEELLELLGVSGVDGGNQILQRALERQELLERVAQQPVNRGLSENPQTLSFFALITTQEVQRRVKGRVCSRRSETSAVRMKQIQTPGNSQVKLVYVLP